MAEQTNIEWCDATFNPWMGCTQVSRACDHCYAEKLVAGRFQRTAWVAGQPRILTSDTNWRQPLQWQRAAADFVECKHCGRRGDARTWSNDVLRLATGRAGCCDHPQWQPARRRVFCASLADVFDNEAPPEWRVRLLRLIADTPSLDWMLLTKRIGNAHAMLSAAFEAGWPNHAGQWHRWAEMFTNIWLGATICDQTEANRDLPKLLATSATVLFVSIEPMLGPINLTRLRLNSGTTWDALRDRGDVATGSVVAQWRPLDMVIAGGESGPGARPPHPAGFRALRDQCQAAGTAFLFKQWGEWGPAGPGGTGRIAHVSAREWAVVAEGDETMPMQRVGKHSAGRLLDGRTHSAWPASHLFAQYAQRVDTL